MKNKLFVLSCLSLLALTGCKGNNNYSKDDFLKEYEKRLANFTALGKNYYKTATVGEDDYVKTPVGKFKIKSALLSYTTLAETDVCLVDFLDEEGKGTSVAAVSGFPKGIIEEAYNYWGKVCNKIDLKTENDNLVFAGYIDNELIAKMAFDKNDYLVEQYMYTFDFSFSIHITYNK